LELDNVRVEPQQAWLGHMPVDMWIHLIADNLTRYAPDIETIIRLRFVNKDMWNICTSNTVWKRLYLVLLSGPLRDQQIENMALEETKTAPDPTFFYRSVVQSPYFKLMKWWICPKCNRIFGGPMLSLNWVAKTSESYRDRLAKQGHKYKNQSELEIAYSYQCRTKGCKLGFDVRFKNDGDFLVNRGIPKSIRIDGWPAVTDFEEALRAK
jgi:hypothetical protein